MKNKRTNEKEGMLGRDEKDDRRERIFNKQSDKMYIDLPLVTPNTVEL